MGLVKFFIYMVEICLIIALILVLDLPPYNVEYTTPYKLDPIKSLIGKLSLNDKLNDVDILYKGQFVGPEAFAEFKGELYTTIHGGVVIKLTNNNNVIPVIKFGKPCNGLYEESKCGRPLGLRFDKSGTLYVTDAYYGLFKVNVTNGESKQLVGIGNEIEDRKVLLPNSLDVANNGDIFWSDSSTNFKLEDGVFDFLSDGSGRLLHYNAVTKQNKVLINKLHFANGVILSDDESFVLVSETARNRIHRYYLKGPKTGKSDIFINGLPGLPDNINPDGKGGFLISLVVSADKDNPGIGQIFGNFPLIRKFISRIFSLLEKGFKAIDTYYTNEFSKHAVHFIGHFSSLTFLHPNRTTIIHLSNTGEILDSLHCTNGKLSLISDTFIYKDYLFFGSPFNDYIGRISLKKVEWEHLKPVNKLPKVTSTTAPPSTTTKKPTTQAPPITTTVKPRTTQAPPITTTTTTTVKPKTTQAAPTTTTTTTMKPKTTQAAPTTTTTTTSKPVKKQSTVYPKKAYEANTVKKESRKVN